MNPVISFFVDTVSYLLQDMDPIPADIRRGQGTTNQGITKLTETDKAYALTLTSTGNQVSSQLTVHIFRL